MNNNVTFTQIVENLTKVFNNEQETAVYNSNSEQYMGICGWCGVMSPLSRPAYVKHFGPATVEKAEQEARARLAENEKQYSESAHAAHVIEADKHQQQGNPAPVVAGSFVWAIHSGLKCDGGDGLAEELRNAAEFPDTMENRRPDLVRVCRVFAVSAADFARPSLADELVSENRRNPEDTFPGGAGMDDEDESRRDLFDEYRYYYTLAAAVVCRESGRWYLINSEGYSYARYILLPTSWRTMYADEVAEAERKEQERKDEEARKESEEKAARLAEYETRCKKWAHLLQDIRPLEEAAEQAKKLHGYGSKEYKQADRALSAARRKNIQTMAAHHFPGVKFSVKKSDRWATAYDVTYQDGPTLETFGKFTDFDLFVQCVETFNGWDDSTDYHHKEFTAFAEKYAGFAYGTVRTEREQSDESRAELLALVQAVAGISDDDRHPWSRETLAQIADRAGVSADELEHAVMYEGQVTAGFIARMVFNLKDYTEPTTTPDKPKGRKATAKPTERTESTETANSKADTCEANSEADTAPGDGLQLIETADGLAVIGNDWKDTYFNKKAIKAHGAKWNKERKQWEATTAEDCETLRRWFALREQTDGQAETISEAAPATLEQAGEIKQGKLTFDESTGLYQTVEAYDPKTDEAVLSDGCHATGKHLKKFGHLCDFDTVKNNNTPADLPGWCAAGCVLRLTWGTWGTPSVVEVSAGCVWIGDNHGTSGYPLDKFIKMVSKGDIAPGDGNDITAAAFASDIVIQAREDHPDWPEEFTTPDFYNREGVTDEHGHRIKTAADIRRQAARIECNYMAGRGGLRDIARRLERTKGADHPDTLRAYERLQSRAARIRRAELEAHRQAGERRRAAYLREHKAA